MACSNTQDCSCTSCTQTGCGEIVYTSCITYTGESGNCLPIVNGEKVSSVIQKIDSKLCEVTNDIDKFVATSPTDNAPNYLFSKLLNDVSFIWSIINVDGEMKVTANVNIDHIVNEIINTPELLELFCNRC